MSNEGLIINNPLSTPPKKGAINAEQQITNLFNSLVSVEGRVCFPCVPSMVEECVNAIAHLVAGFGQPLSLEDRDRLREGMAEFIQKGFEKSPLSQLTIEYRPNEPPETGLFFEIETVSPTPETSYQNWIQRRQKSSDRPDAKIVAIANALEKSASILEIGGGRNGLALGRSGYKIEIVESVLEFATELTEIAKREELFLSVKKGSIFDPVLRLRPAGFDLAIASDFIPACCRSLQDIRLLLAKLCDGVKSGSSIVLGMFLAEEGYEPCDRIIELSQVRGCYFQTRSQLQEIVTDLPLELRSDESFLEGETNLPEALIHWGSGRDLFPPQEESLLEFRWIICQRM